MHDAARFFLTEAVNSMGLAGRSALDLGGRDVNGSIHSLFVRPPTVLDILDSPGVDIVADAADWEPDRKYGVVLCTEVFEHTPRWREIIYTAHRALEPGGMLLVTCASRDRPPHSAFDGGPLRDGEHYLNIPPAELASILAAFQAFAVFAVDGVFGNDDLYAWARR